MLRAGNLIHSRVVQPICADAAIAMHSYNARLIAEGLGFLEGPVALDDGRILFTDIGEGSLKTVDPESGIVELFCHLGGAANGVAVGPDGAFYICNNGGMTCVKSETGINIPLPGTHGNHPISPCIQKLKGDGKVEILYSHCSGIPLVAPNDLVFDRSGGFYFTDTGHPSGRIADLGGLFYAKADGSFIAELVHEAAPHVPLTQPNGCGLSPDGNRLYVAETGGARLWYWNILGPGRLKPDPDGFLNNGAVFLHGSSAYQMYDSLAVDSAGYVCVAAIMKGGIDVIAPDGGLADFVALPDYDPFPTNICFGGEGLRKAYVTASGTGKIYEIDWPRPGLRLNY